MSIIYYCGTDGVTINIESGYDLVRALDILHTQTIDNCNEDVALLKILDEAIEKCREIGYDV
jgi:hypothetical protein